MSASASWALQKAIHEALAADAALIAVLGGTRIHDDPPQDGPFPFVSLGQTSAVDWGTGTEDGEEHTVTLHVWSRQGGKKEAQAIMAAIRTVLHQASLTLGNHRLVNLRHEFSDARRDADGETMHGTVRYRAVTEPL